MKKLIFMSILFFIFKIAPGIHGEELTEPAWVYKGRGDRFYREGEVGKAIVEYKKALTKTKIESVKYGIAGYPEVNLKLAKIYLNEDLYDLAILHIDMAEKYSNLFQIPDLAYELKYTMAEIYLRLKKYKESMEIYNQIIEEDENWRFFSIENDYEFNEPYILDSEGRIKFGKAYFELGKVKFQTLNFENAIPYLKMAMRYGYNADATLNYLINSYKSLGNRTMVEKVMKTYSSK